MKKILLFLLIFLSVFLIYIGFKDEKVFYYNITTETSNNSYNDKIKEYLVENNLLENYVNTKNNNMRITDIINIIEKNNKVLLGNKYKYIQNILIKSDIITISIDYSNYFEGEDIYSNFERSLVDFEKLFLLIRKYCKEQIFFVGVYSEDKNINMFVEYINNELIKLTNKYNIEYIELYKNYEKSKFDDLVYEKIVKKIEFNK